MQLSVRSFPVGREKLPGVEGTSFLDGKNKLPGVGGTSFPNPGGRQEAYRLEGNKLSGGKGTSFPSVEGRKLPVGRDKLPGQGNKLPGWKGTSFPVKGISCPVVRE